MPIDVDSDRTEPGTPGVSRMRRWIRIAVLACLAFSIASCSHNPLSQRRIQRRRAHLQETAAGLRERERRSPRYLRELLNDLDKWNRAGAVRFRRRVREIGDRAL